LSGKRNSFNTVRFSLATMTRKVEDVISDLVNEKNKIKLKNLKAFG
jgi:hypothetical protein